MKNRRTGREQRKPTDDRRGTPQALPKGAKIVTVDTLKDGQKRINAIVRGVPRTFKVAR